MSSYSLNTILNSYVNEQAYLPLCRPDKECVLSEGAKGSFCSKDSTLDNLSSISEEFFTSLCVLLMKCFSKTSFGKLFVPVSNGVHCVFYRVKSNGVGFLLNFKNTLFKGFPFFLFFKEITYKVHDFLKSLFRKFEEHFINIGYFQCFHIIMIKNKAYYVNTYRTEMELRRGKG